MGALTFLSGCLVGALIATLLTQGDTLLYSDEYLGGTVPLSLSEALAQIRQGWDRPTRVLIGMLLHPLLLCLALALILAGRRCWRAFVTRTLWIRCPSVIKLILEFHASLLGVIVVAGLLSGAVVTIAGLAAIRDADSLSAVLEPLWQHSLLLSGLLAQGSLPFAIHPALAPRLLDTALGVLDVVTPLYHYLVPRRVRGDPARHGALGPSSWPVVRRGHRLPMIATDCFCLLLIAHGPSCAVATDCFGSPLQCLPSASRASECFWLLLVASGCFWLLLVASGSFWLLLVASGCF